MTKILAYEHMSIQFNTYKHQKSSAAILAKIRRIEAPFGCMERIVLSSKINIFKSKNTSWLNKEPLSSKKVLTFPYIKDQEKIASIYRKCSEFIVINAHNSTKSNRVKKMEMNM